MELEWNVITHAHSLGFREAWLTLCHAHSGVCKHNDTVPVSEKLKSKLLEVELLYFTTLLGLVTPGDPLFQPELYL